MCKLFLMVLAVSVPPEASPVSDFRVKTVDGVVYEGTVLNWQWGDFLRLRASDGKTVRVSTRNLDHIQALREATGRTSGKWCVRTRLGSRLYGDIRGGDEERLQIDHAHLGAIAWPIDQIHSMTRSGSANDHEPQSDEDVVVLQNGDSSRGAVVRMDAGGVVLYSNDFEHALKWSVIRSIQFADAGDDDIETMPLRLRLTDGSEIGSSQLKWAGRQVWLHLDGKLLGPCDASRIAFIESVGGRRVWLSALPPSRYVHTPYFSRKWRYRFDANVVGDRLRLNGRDYHRGVGLHAACRATWNLNGNYERFTCLAGIDDSAGRLANADVVFIVDGDVRERFEGMQRSALARKVELDLTGATTLTIEVGFGRNGPVQDRVNIVNPALLKAPSSP